MPLALLLRNMNGILSKAGSALAPWTQIVPLESTIVERARSAFLVHWFGPRVPVDGLSLKAIIVNIDQLAAQRQLAERSMPQTATGPNLLEPIMSFAGMAAGVLISPMGAVAGVITMLRVADISVKTVLGAIAWILGAIAIVFGMVVAPAGTSILVGGLIASGIGGLALAMGLSDRRDIRALYNLFAALAAFMNAAVLILRQIMGGASAATNPLLKQILQLTTPLAAFMAQLLGAAAVLIRRVAPVLPSVAAMLVDLKALISSAVDALSEIVHGLLDRIDQVRNGPLSLTAVFDRVVGVAKQQIARIQASMKSELAVLSAALDSIKTSVSSAFTSFIAEVTEFLKYLWKTHPVIQTIDAFRTQIDIIKRAFETAPKPKKSTEPGFFDPLIATLPALPKAPEFPPTPTVPDAEKLKAALGVKDVPPLNFESIQAAAEKLGKAREPIVLSSDAQAAIDRMTRRPSIFQGERRQLANDLGKAPQAALEENAKALTKFRETFAVVVGRILPPEMRAVYAPQLAETFAMIDEKLYGKEPSPAKKPFPVLDLPANDELRPIVKLLRFRMPGADSAQVRAFQDRFLDRLQKSSYRVHTAAPATVGAP